MPKMIDGERVGYSVEYRIQRSTLFLSGDSFTASDMSGRVQACTKVVQDVLNRLIRDDKAMITGRMASCHIYAKKDSARKLMAIPLVNDMPPVVAGKVYLNPWVFNLYIEESSCA